MNKLSLYFLIIGFVLIFLYIFKKMEFNVILLSLIFMGFLYIITLIEKIKEVEK